MKELLLLALSKKPRRDILGPESVVPSALVHRVFPSFCSYLGANVPQNTLAERFIVTQKAHKIVIKELASAKIKLALKLKTLIASDMVYRFGDQVFVWREKQVEHRMRKYLIPYSVIAYDMISTTV